MSRTTETEVREIAEGLTGGQRIATIHHCAPMIVPGADVGSLDDWDDIEGLGLVTWGDACGYRPTPLGRAVAEYLESEADNE